MHRFAIVDAEFPAECGVYVVWAPERPTQPLYVGRAATQTIEQRWRRQHLLNRAGGSALRRSLGVHLGLVEQKLSVKRDGRFYPPDVEAAITTFLRTCEIEFIVAGSPEEAIALEVETIARLRPTLNARRRPKVTRTPDDLAILSEARELYERCAKPALTRGLFAVRPNARLDAATGYVLDLGDNVVPGLESAAREAFESAPGNELESKMRAPWSSAALAVNSFLPWRRELPKLRLAGRRGFGGRLKFECPCPNGVSGFSSYLDVLLRKGNEVVAVESKSTEYLQGGSQEIVAAGYRRLKHRGDWRCDSRWYAALEQVETYLFLDAYQLVKHYLALRWTFRGAPLTLVYLYWEPTGALTGRGAHLFERHRRELERFTELVRGDETCAFEPLTYGEHWAELEALAASEEWLRDHLRLLRARYAVEL